MPSSLIASRPVCGRSSSSRRCKMARSLCRLFCVPAREAQLPLTGPGNDCFRAQRFSRSEDRVRRKLRSPRGDKRNTSFLTDDCHFVRREFDYPRSLTNTPIPQAICSSEQNRSRPSPAANTNGSWRNFIRPWRCFITVSFGAARNRRALARALATTIRWKAEFSFRLFRGGLYRHDHGPTF